MLNHHFWDFQEEKLPYAFYISDQELVVQLGTYLQKNKGFKFSALLAPTALLFGGTFLNDTYLAL